MLASGALFSTLRQLTYLFHVSHELVHVLDGRINQFLIVMDAVQRGVQIRQGLLQGTVEPTVSAETYFCISS